MTHFLSILIGGYVVLAVALTLRFGLQAKSESEDLPRLRAKLIATLSFVSSFIVLPALFTIYDLSLPVYEFDGVLAAVRIVHGSSRHFSAQLIISTSSGGTITVHDTAPSLYLQPGQHLHVRYYGETGELIDAMFFGSDGQHLAEIHSSNAFVRTLSILFGSMAVWFTIRRYRLDRQQAIEASQMSDSPRDESAWEQEDLTEAELDQIRASANLAYRTEMRRSFFVTTAFACSCLTVWLISAEGPLHRFWENIGALVVAAAFLLLMATLYCGLSAFLSWRYSRSLDRIRAC